MQYLVVQKSEYYRDGYSLIASFPNEGRARKYRNMFFKGDQGVEVMSKEEYKNMLLELDREAG